MGECEYMKGIFFRKICLSLLGIIMFFGLTGCGKTEINLENYVRFSQSGYDGYGSAEVEFDELRLYSDIYRATSKDKNKDNLELNSLNDLLNMEELYNSYNDISNSISVMLDNDYDLSNGDIVTAEIRYNNDIAKDYKIKFTGESVTKTIDSLEPIKEMDPFDYVTVNFSGISTKGNVSVTANGISVDDFSIDGAVDGSLKNGDIITVSIINTEDTAQYGYVYSCTEKDYTVNGLMEYLQSMNDLPDYELSGFLEKSENAVISEINRLKKKYTKFDADYEFSGYTFVNDLHVLDSSTENVLFCYYTAKINFSNYLYNAQCNYVVKYEDIYRIDGGELNYEDKGLQGDSFFPQASGSTAGFLELKDAKAIADSYIYPNSIVETTYVYDDSNISLIESFDELSEDALAGLESETSTLVKNYVVNTLQKKYTSEFGDPVLYEKRLYCKDEENVGIYIYKVHAKQSSGKWETDMIMPVSVYGISKSGDSYISGEMAMLSEDWGSSLPQSDGSFLGYEDLEEMEEDFEADFFDYELIR